MDVLVGAGYRRGHVAYPEKHNRGARAENAEVAMRQSEGGRGKDNSEKDPDVKPTRVSRFPGWERKIRCGAAPVRSLLMRIGENRRSSVAFCFDPERDLIFVSF